MNPDVIFIPEIRSPQRETISYICRIKPYLYLSDFEAASASHVLKKLNIRLVICLSYTEHSSVVKYDYRCDGIAVKYFKVDDDPSVDLMPICNRIHLLIEKTISHSKKQADRSILLHCHGGVSRSPTAVLYHLMKGWKMTYWDAYTYVKQLRPIICPNDGFKQQLQQYETTQAIEDFIKELPTYEPNQTTSVIEKVIEYLV